MKKIGLVVAMKEETEYILDKLGNDIRKDNICGYEIDCYNINNKNIYLINSGIGEINAAAATMLLICKYGVEIIINFGIAGALISEINIGDLLIAKDIIHTDFDASAFFSIPKGRYLDKSTTELVCDNKLIALAEKLYGKSIRKVRIASADKFVATKKIKQELINEFNADICEMESAGIIRVAQRANIPALFIKTISDKADENAEKSMDETVNKGIDQYAILIEKIIKEL